MGCLRRLISTVVLGGAVTVSGMACAQVIQYPPPGAGPLPFERGIYYPTGMPLVTPNPNAPGSLMEGRSAVVGVVGNHCTTPAAT
ncbi:MAG TPA: hypothetical protein VEQ35_02350, partial [Beijerinckia sp.]|nr:hypothetical protein [Beijerinckia sp.]